MDKCNNKFLELDKFIEEHREEKGNLIGVLHFAQGLYGYLGEELQEHIAKKLDIPKAKVFGVISFYSYFTTKPKGKYIISVCTGTACFVRGAGDILDEFKNVLGIKEGQTTNDGLFTLETLRCVGACGLAPVVTINDKIYGKFTKNQVIEVLKEYKE